MEDCHQGPAAVMSMIIGFFECAFFSLVSIGWPNLVYLYKDLGLFPGVCPNATEGNSTVSCPEVAKYYNICFTVAECARLASLLGWGILFDKYGLLITRLVSVFLFIPGCLCLAFASAELSWLMFVGLPLVAVGAVNICVTAANICSQAGKRTAMVTTLYSGGMDASIFVFFLIKELHEGLNIRPTVSLSCLGGLYTLPLANAFFLLPHYKVGMEKPIPRSEQNANQVEKDKVRFKDILKTPLFLLMLAWTSIMLLKFTFGIGGMNLWLEVGTGGSDMLVSKYLAVFSYVSLGGLLASPITGLITDQTTQLGLGSKAIDSSLGKARCFVPTVVLTTVIAMIHSILSLFWNGNLVYAYFVFFVLFRTFLFGTWFSFVGIVFPVGVAGKVLGVSFIIAGCFTLIQYGFFTWAANTSFAPVNGCILVLVALSPVFPIYILYAYRKLAQLRKDGAHNRHINSVDSVTKL